MSTILLIDGQNFLEKIKTVLKDNGVLKKDERINWCEYDFAGLFDKVLQGFDINDKNFYTAKIKEHPETREKSKELIEEQRLLKTCLEQKQGIKYIIAGRVTGQLQKCCKKLAFKQKGVDVRIAVDMFIISLVDKTASEIILASSDSDLLPAMKEIKKRSEISMIYLGFELSPNKALAYTAGREIIIRNSEVIAHYKKQLKL